MNRRLPVLTGAASGDRRLAAMRRWLMLALALVQVVIIAGLLAGGLSAALEKGDGLFLAGAVAPRPFAFLIHVPIALGYLGFAVLALHPRYRDDTLFYRIGWLVLSGLAFDCARLAAGPLGMGWIVAPLGLLALLVLGRALVVIARWPRPISLARRSVIHVPIGLHAGWLTGILPLNVLASLPRGPGEPGVSVAGGFLALAGLLLLAVAGVRLTRAEPPYVAALLWLLLAIALRAATPSFAQPLVLMAGLSAILILALAIWTRTQRRPSIFG
jgi:hypothetical protein